MSQVHVFGTDRMSTEDLMRYFVIVGVTTAEDAPRWVEWVNDSSANVVFGSAEAAAAAMTARTVALLPEAQAVDTLTWRTQPVSDAAAGKGLQLLFRIATTRDVKPPKRGASRWYGESEGARRRSGGKAGGVADKRERRQQGNAPYQRSAGPAARLAQQGDRMLKRSLAETIAIRNAPAGPTLADTMQQAPTLASMAASAAAEDDPLMIADGPTLADMAARHVEVLPTQHKDRSGETDLRKRLKGDRAAKREAEPQPQNFSYAAAKAEMAAEMDAEAAEVEATPASEAAGEVAPVQAADAPVDADATAE